MSTRTLTVIALLSLTGLALAGDEDKKPEASKPVAPRAPSELADRVRLMTGLWKCDGTGSGMDGKSMAFKGTMKSKAELDGAWLHSSFAGTIGDVKGATRFGFESYTTFDSNTKKWRTMFMDNFGGQMVGIGDPMKDGKLDTTSDAIDPHGKALFKDHVDASDPKQGVRMSGEESRDNGKSWNKIYDMTCTK